jgi:hypothetical protein
MIASFFWGGGKKVEKPLKQKIIGKKKREIEGGG